MRLLHRNGDRGITPVVGLFLLFVVAPSANLSAQNPSTFDELAADAAAAGDVNDVPRAIELYQKALQLRPEWADGWMSLGALEYGSGAFAAATDSLSRVLALNPGSGQALALRGLSEFETGNYPASLADIRKGLAAGAADDAPHEQILRYHEAMLLTRLGNFEEALKTYSVFAERNLSSPELLVASGLAGLRIPLLPKEVSADQRELLIAAGEAIFKFKQGDDAAAEDAFKDLFEHYPTARNLHFLYGELLQPSSPEAAIPQFKKELEIAPDNTNATIMLAWSLLLQNRPDEALPYAKRIAQTQPERAGTQLILGRALLDTGNLSAGIEHLEHGLKLEPDNLELHIALAKAYSKSGRDQDARRERALCLKMANDSASRIVHP